MRHQDNITEQAMTPSFYSEMTQDEGGGLLAVFWYQGPFCLREHNNAQTLLSIHRRARAQPIGAQTHMRVCILSVGQ